MDGPRNDSETAACQFWILLKMKVKITKFHNFI
jgi:hypothetical protein